MQSRSKIQSIDSVRRSSHSGYRVVVELTEAPETWIASIKGECLSDKVIAEFEQINRDLLQSVSMKTLSGVSEVGSEVKALNSKVDILIGRQTGGLRRSSTFGNKWDELLFWLSDLDHLTKYNELSRRVLHRPNAGKWLLESQPFQDWRDGEHDKLWYTGERKSIYSKPDQLITDKSQLEQERVCLRRSQSFRLAVVDWLTTPLLVPLSSRTSRNIQSIETRRSGQPSHTYIYPTKMI